MSYFLDCHIAFTQLLSKIVKIEQQNSQILAAFKQTSENCVSMPKLNVALPMKTIEELTVVLENELTQKEQNVTYLVCAY